MCYINIKIQNTPNIRSSLSSDDQTQYTSPTAMIIVQFRKYVTHEKHIRQPGNPQTWHVLGCMGKSLEQQQIDDAASATAAADLAPKWVMQSNRCCCSASSRATERSSNKGLGYVCLLWAETKAPCISLVRLTWFTALGLKTNIDGEQLGCKSLLSLLG